MKTSVLFSSILASLTLLTAACTPRDVPVVDKNKRAAIQAQNNRKSGGGGGSRTGAGGSQSGEFTLRNYGISSFLVDRHVEAIELIKLVTGTMDAGKTSFAVEKAVPGQDGALKTTLTSKDFSMEYVSEEQAWKFWQSKTFNATFATQGNEITSLKVLQKEPLKMKIDAADKKRFYVNLFEDSYELNLRPVGENYEITVITQGNLSGAKGGANSPNKVGVKIKMLVSKDSLETSEVKIVSVESKMTYPGKNKEFSVDLKANNVLVNVDGNCHTIKGSFNAKAGNSGFDVAFDGSDKFKINKKVEVKMPLCGKRPVVDLSRLQSL